MSFGVGIGDVVLIITETLALFKSIDDAPAELDAARRDMEQMKVSLQFLREGVKDEQSFVSSRPDIAKMITNDLKPLKNDVREIESMMGDFINKSSVNVLGRLRYAVLDKTRLNDLRKNLGDYRRNFGHMLDLINVEAHNQNKAVDQEVFRKLDGIAEAQRREERQRKADEIKQEEMRRGVEEILKLVQNPLSPTQTRSSTDDLLHQLEEGMVSSGIPRAEAAPHLRAITNLLRGDPSPRVAVPQNAGFDSENIRRWSQEITLVEDSDREDDNFSTIANLERPKHSSNRKRPVSAPIPANIPMRKSPVPLPTTVQHAVPLSTTMGLAPLDIENLRVLCVDGSNGIRSIIAQTYLEIMRSYRVHSNGRWVFKRVESAGYYVATPFSRPFIEGIPYENLGSRIPPSYTSGIQAHDYSWSASYPREAYTILERMKNETVQGIRREDFEAQGYGIMLCFSEDVRIKLEMMKLSANQNNPNVVCPQIRKLQLLGTPKQTKDCLNDPEKMKEVVREVKDALSAFVNKELFPTSPTVVSNGQKGARTLQLLLKSRDIAIIERSVSVAEQPRVKELEKASGCAIQITRTSSGEYLVSVIGPQGSNERGGNSDCLLERVEAVLRGRFKWQS